MKKACFKCFHKPVCTNFKKMDQTIATLDIENINLDNVLTEVMIALANNCKFYNAFIQSESIGG